MKSFAFAGMLLFGGAIAGCGTSGEASATLDELGEETPPEGAKSGPVGTVELQLTLGNAEFLTFDYHISGSLFAKAGTIDVAGSETVSAIIGAIPLATGYQITLQGQSTGEPVLSCTGTATFNVASAGVTPVPVPVQCREGTAAAASAVPVPQVANLALCAALLGLGMTLISRKQSRVQA